ncbi:hypothetical protein RND81_09G109000 [Saponaria officinalis]|uniref:LysM domain receptor-like kinase 3 n=1 Tax=Saponaria officinalis TaxID=3572 RepID=A0AAW1ILG3_SAPOF
MKSFYITSLILLLITLPISKSTLPMNCSDTTRLCTSFLALKPDSNLTLSLIESMFDVFPKDVTVENTKKDYIFVKKNCSCDPKLRKYLTYTTFTVRNRGGFVGDLVGDAYKGLAYLGGSKSGRKVRVGEVISVRLFCGCSSGLWNYLVSYVMNDGDTIASLASRFGVSMDSIEQLNGISNPNNVTLGDLYYVPLNAVPGDPYPVETSISPAPAPTPPTSNVTENITNHEKHVPYGWIITGLGICLALLVIPVFTCVILRSSICHSEIQGSHPEDSSERHAHKFQILRNTSICCASGRFCNSSDDWQQTSVVQPNNHHPINIPRGINRCIGNEAFDVEKPVVYTYDDIMTATDGFSEANLLGHGTYGSVYYGLLHDQAVAIKKMAATKTREFMAEMKVLCKVHHTNLVELLGYAATADDLFVIYEFAQKGSLKNHLHNKGHTPLSWIMRVQIALDAARGLEYIHEHTKTHYVHRDIKSSNILLDEAFRGKISDFGLSKLIGTAGDGEVSATRVVGTYGYLAPEYLSNGLATTKSDVYAFGVVLFEMISGKEAITRIDTTLKGPERRSLVSIMLASLRHVPDSMSMSSLRDYIDQNLMDLYPHDCVYKMAMLAKQCVDEDPVLRPDLKQVVISLSQILLSSVEWEATLAGNSQVFSGLVQGR